MNTKSEIKVYTVILNGEKTPFELKKFEALHYELYEKNHLFGERAKANEAPIKLTVVFADGTIQNFRGDKFASKVERMVSNMYGLMNKYYAANNMVKATMYDNQNLVTNNKIISMWEKDKGTVVNLLPIYLKGYKL